MTSICHLPMKTHHIAIAAALLLALVSCRQGNTSTSNSVTIDTNVEEEFIAFQTELQELYYKDQQAISAAFDDGDEARAMELSAERDKAVSDLCMSYFEKHSNDQVGLLALSIYIQTNDGLGSEEMEALISRAGDALREDESLQEMLAARKAAESSSEGCAFIDIEGCNLDGAPVRLSDFAGRGGYVLVDFWASWCGPCMNAIPTLKSLQSRYGGKGLKIVGVNCWEEEAGNGPAAAKERKMTWPVIFADDSAANMYGIQAIPTLILIAPDGTIARRIVGEAEVVAAVEAAFAN